MQQSKPDIVALTEGTQKISYGITSDPYNISVYNMFSSDLHTGRMIIIYTLKTLLDTQFQESVWCNIKSNKQITCYTPTS